MTWPASICVYCGSSTGDRVDYADSARRLGTLLARRGIGLVFGGGSVGLMGVLADAVLAAGGKVTGVIPQGLRTEELAHEGVSEMITVDSMHARKQRMVELSDAFIAMPGGIGTLDELFETFTWLQLGIHSKPVGEWNAYDIKLVGSKIEVRLNGELVSTSESVDKLTRGYLGLQGESGFHEYRNLRIKDLSK